MSQNHFTLSLPLKSPAAAKLVAEQLSPLMPNLFAANDAIGTVHYSRFTVLSEKTLLFLGDFDGEFDKLMADLAGRAGPVFDAVFQFRWSAAHARRRQRGRFRQMDEGASDHCGKSLHSLSERNG
jgi:hypothetical protein